MLAHNSFSAQSSLHRPNYASGSAIGGSPFRRNGSFLGLTALLLFGMFSVASAANRTRIEPAPPAVKADPIAEDQSDAVSTMNGEPNEAIVLTTLNELRDANPDNAVYSYLMAAHYADKRQWKSALGALEIGNETPKFTLARSASRDGTYATLFALRQLTADCCGESLRRGRDKTTDEMLQQCENLANRMAREAMPCDLPVLSNAAGVYESVDRVRLIQMVAEGRTHEANAQRAHLAAWRKWWRSAFARSRRIDSEDPELRVTVAENLRSRLQL
jgi:hypothetical protein